MILPKQTQYRILRTMERELTKTLVHTASELSELAVECSKAAIEYLKDGHIPIERINKMSLELADVLVMLTAITHSVGISDMSIMNAVIEVCERYEQA